MSTPSPLQPPDALDSASTPKSRMRVTVLTILALHVVFIGGLLMQGCDKKSGTNPSQGGTTASSLPSLGDTNNYFSNFPGDAPSAVSGTTGASGVGASAIPPVEAAFSPPETATPGGVGGLGGLADAGGTGTGGSIAGGGVGMLPVAATPTEPVSGFAGGMTEHVIKPGDMIGDLAKQYGVSAQAIFDANPNAKPRSLKVGDRLLIPPPTPATPRAASAAAPGTTEGEVYIVRQGDNLSKIAKKFGVTVKALRAANGLRGDRILPKQRLTIPGKATASGQAN